MRIARTITWDKSNDASVGNSQEAGLNPKPYTLNESNSKGTWAHLIWLAVSQGKCRELLEVLQGGRVPGDRRGGRQHQARSQGGRWTVSVSH